MDPIVNVTPNGLAWTFLGICGCIALFLMFRSASMRTQLKRGAIFLLFIAAISAGYFFLTGKSPTEIPAEINRFFNTPRAPEKTKHTYYRDPEERSGGQLRD